MGKTEAGELGKASRKIVYAGIIVIACSSLLYVLPRSGLFEKLTGHGPQGFRHPLFGGSPKHAIVAASIPAHKGFHVSTTASEAAGVSAADPTNAEEEALASSGGSHVLPRGNNTSLPGSAAVGHPASGQGTVSPGTAGSKGTATTGTAGTSTAKLPAGENPSQPGTKPPAAKPPAAVPALAQGKVIYNIKTTKKLVALTFDDGPDKKNTAKVLDVLKKYKIKATFFLIGKNAKANPDLVKRMIKEGHVLGNHSWDHADLTKLDGKKLLSEVNDTDNEIRKITGSAPALFRAPYGSVNNGILQSLTAAGHQIIGWNVDTRDWDGRKSSLIVENIKQHVKPGSIVLQHCAGGKGGDLSNTVKALPEIITYLQKQGYSFVTVPELLQL